MSLTVAIIDSEGEIIIWTKPEENCCCSMLL